MKGQTQILYIHGGMTFKNNKDYLRHLKTKKIKLKRKAGWSGEYLNNELGRKFQIIRPRMPLQDNAKYSDWKVWFERHLPYLKSNFILIGESLGGIFLAKYLSENKLPRKALSAYLVCPPYDNTIPNEDLVNGFRLKPSLSLLEKNARNIHFLFSRDDDVVPFNHAEKYQAKLSNVHMVVYKSKNGHFQISTFPEIVKMIKSDVKRN